MERGCINNGVGEWPQVPLTFLCDEEENTGDKGGEALGQGRALFEATQAGPVLAIVSQGGAWKPWGVTFLLGHVCPAHSEAPRWDRSEAP